MAHNSTQLHKTDIHGHRREITAMQDTISCDQDIRPVRLNRAHKFWRGMAR